jgi:hypothetical protein
VRAPVGIAAVIRAGEADRATTRRDPGSGKEASGRRARTGDWPVGSCSSAGWSGATSSDGTAGRNRGSRREEEEGKEGGGADRRARAVSRRGKWGAGGAGLSELAERGRGEGRTGRLAGLSVGEGRENGPWGKGPRGVGLLGWFALFQTLFYLLF